MPVDEKKTSSAYLLSEIGISDEAARLRAQASILLALELPGILATLPQGGRFFDLGCGSGLLTDAVALARPDAQVHGFDADPMAVEVSRKHFGARAGLGFDCRRLEEGPPPGFERADTAVLRLVLMHLPEPAAALKSAAAWVKPGGMLHVLECDDRALAFEPAQPQLDEALALMQRVQVYKGGSRHLGRGLAALMSSAGWAVRGQGVHSPDAVAAAAALPKVFLPVAEYYLSEAQRMGLARPERVQELSQALRNPGNGVLNRALIPIFHVWAQANSVAK
jgi:SAM-dependent methyltransferase